jgi:hypothetical protein
MRFEVLMAVKMSMLVSWVVTPYGLVGRYQRLGGTYCLHLQKMDTIYFFETLVAYLQNMEIE